MSRYGAPRDSLPRPFEGYPAYGAVHEVLPSVNVREFLLKIAQISDKVFMQAELGSAIVLDNRLPDEISDDELVEPDVSGYDSRQYYKIFDVEKLGVSVVEMDPSAQHARAMRSVWESQDFGVVEQEAKNEIGRTTSNQPMHLSFTSVRGVGRRLPGVPNTSVRQKVALLPDPNVFMGASATIDSEAGIIIEHIRNRLRLKQFVYPVDIIPHLTFAVFKKDAEPEQITKIIEATNDELQAKAVLVRLGDLVFRSKSERKRRH